MQNRFITLLVLLFSLAALAYAQDDKDKFKARYENQESSSVFDPHDLSGIWTLTRNDHSLGTPAPPLTPAGAAAMKGRITDRGGVIGNAPWYTCNPMGFPRLLNDDEPMELMMLNDRVLQVFQWEHRIRYIWTDGRELPSGENLENLGPAWYGHSIAQWEGNTLVVNTTGLDERAWLDNQGHPKSFHARIEERYTRTGPDTIEFHLTLHDPKFYTAPWVGAKRVYRRLPENEYTFQGFKSLYSGNTDAICAPMNEAEDYNKRIRDPAAFGDKK